MTWGRGSNLPPGTYEGDPRAPWNQPEDLDCKCGHLLSEHDEGRCEVPGCGCCEFREDC